MTSRYERHAELDDMLDRAGKLSVRTMIVDVEPLVSWWDDGQEALDQGVAMVIGKVAALPTVRVLVFATNSARRSSADSPSSRITDRLSARGRAPDTARSLTVPLTASSPIDPPGKRMGLTT